MIVAGHAGERRAAKATRHRVIVHTDDGEVVGDAAAHLVAGLDDHVGAEVGDGHYGGRGFDATQPGHEFGLLVDPFSGVFREVGGLEHGAPVARPVRGFR